MNYLLDTHVAIWSFLGDDRIGKDIQELLVSAENRIFYSVASMWEVAIKYKAKPEKIPFSAEEFLHFCEMSDYSKLNIRDLHVLEYQKLPSVHGDPFDNMILAQAVSEGMTLLTHDAAFKKFPQEQTIYVRFI